MGAGGSDENLHRLRPFHQSWQHEHSHILPALCSVLGRGIIEELDLSTEERENQCLTRNHRTSWS